jgi:succinate-semialdehyde dehydrogenase/glutarate-semialdehyde dehydrogenase
MPEPALSIGSERALDPPKDAKAPRLANPDLWRELALVGDDWIATRETIAVENPATGRSLGAVPNLGRAETDTAISAAELALAGWRQTSAAERAAILRRWNDLVLANTEDLARILTAEEGKPLAEARAEVRYAASFIAWFAEEALRSYGDIIPGHARDKRLAVLREPVGVVAAITPWNFPLAMITRKVAPALAAGCTIVLKPSELTPFSALALAVLAEQAGLPPGALSVLTGHPGPIGEALTSDPRVRKLSFTGSTAVGKLLAARCMATVKRLSLELGGNAPFIVFDDADVEAAVDGLLASKFRNAGQTCVSANRILVQAGAHDAFVDRLCAKVSAMRMGDGFDEDTTIGPLISKAAVAKVQSHVDDALARGGQLLSGGAVSDGPGAFFRPTVIGNVSRDALLCREETFGPLAGVVRFTEEAEAISAANASSAGLAAYVYTNELSRSHRVVEALQYGMVGLNTGLISTEVAPFGGIKESGFGREGSRYGLEEYLNMKMVCAEVKLA